MVNRLKLNENLLRDAEPQEGNSYQIFDTEIRGLAAKVQPSGTEQSDENVSTVLQRHGRL